MSNQDNVFDSRVSAMYKNLVLARMPDPALRSSSHVVQCPGKDDCSNTCAIKCAEQHLSSLRAFSVTGEQWSDHFTPRSPPPDSPSPPPPSPPATPFSECANTCTLEPKYETTCRDGGYGSYFPSMCAYSTWCKICGPRYDTDVVTQDDSCATSGNGICEDGGEGSLYFADSDGGQTHLCGYGTDFTDCAAFGERTITTRSEGTYAGTTNVTRPTPPPPQPAPPTPPSPPPVVETFNPCVTDPADICHAFFDNDNNLLCSGTIAQIDAKFAAGVCTGDYGFYANQQAYTDQCSDGGYYSLVIKRKDTPYEASTFACNYGSQCAQCGARPKKEIMDCEDTCGLDSPAAAAFRASYGTLPEVIGTASGLGASSPPAPPNNIMCRDGGTGSESAHCPFGSQCLRCGARRVVFHSVEPYRGIESIVVPPPPSPPPPPPSPPPPIYRQRRLTASENLKKAQDVISQISSMMERFGLGGRDRRRAQTGDSVGAQPPPPPSPPPPPPVLLGQVVMEQALSPSPPPEPVPPPPPPRFPPPQPPPSPNPPPYPPGSYQAGRCSCFTEEEDDTSWSDIEIRAKSEYVESSAVRCHSIQTLELV